LVAIGGRADIDQPLTNLNLWLHAPP